MKFKKLDKCFARLHHYTDSPGAKGILKYGFSKDKVYQKRPYGISFFEDCDDYIKNNDANLYKLASEFRHNLDTKGRKWFHGNLDKNHRIIPDKDFENSFLHQANLGYLKQKHQYKTNDKLDKSEFINEFRQLPEVKNPKYPIEMAQVSHMSGAVWKNKNKGIYRVTTDTKNDKDLYTVTGLLETRVPEKNINNEHNKIEIPKGMYNKDTKKEYIDDYNDFKKSDYNTDDKYTREVVNKIKTQAK